MGDLKNYIDNGIPISYMITVSYTHLDVYKRQVSGTSVLIRKQEQDIDKCRGD